jgi:hypothetical protein
MADRIERFFVPTLAQLEPLKSNTVNGETLLKVQAVLQRWQDERDFSYADALRECDTLLETCGIESIDPEGSSSYTDEGVRLCPPFSYCNTGDSYAATLARDHKEHAWVVAGWADLLTEYEQEEELGDYERFDKAPESCPACGKVDTFEVEAFEKGEHTPAGWVKSGTGFAFVCSNCNHHCMTPDDWTPPAEETDEETDED